MYFKLYMLVHDIIAITLSIIRVLPTLVDTLNPPLIVTKYHYFRVTNYIITTTCPSSGIQAIVLVTDHIITYLTQLLHTVRLLYILPSYYLYTQLSYCTFTLCFLTVRTRSSPLTRNVLPKSQLPQKWCSYIYSVRFQHCSLAVRLLY